MKKTTKSPEPCCGFCGSTKIGRTTKMFLRIPGLYIYCENCGAIITWVPKPSYLQ